MPAKPVLNWTAELHDKKGYLRFADGSVVLCDESGMFSTGRLSESAGEAVRAYTNNTGKSDFRLLIP
jgi:hypothetical protein